MNIANYIDLTTAATRLGVTYVAARNWVITGKLRGEQRLGGWFVDADHLDQIMRERKLARKQRLTGNRRTQQKGRKK